MSLPGGVIDPSVPPGVLDFVKTYHHESYELISPLNANLQGKAILITGASKGIGRATAVSYARAGTSYIAVAARSSLGEVSDEIKRAAKEAGHQEPQILELEMDVTNQKSVAAAAKALKDAFNDKLDILIANHGTLEPFIPLIDSDPDTWWSTYEVNVKGAYLVARFFLPFLQKRDSLGIFVGVSSIGQHLLTIGASSYQSGKLALHRICEFICIETAMAESEGKAEKRVSAFVIHPGGVATGLAQKLPEHMRSALVDKPELAGDSLVWLTKERREWLNGRYVAVNWDMGELLERKQEVEEKNLLKMKMTY